nr:acidic proline-rich protein PRP25-like [Cavia porcellus]
MVPWTLCSMSGRTFVTTHLRATRDGSRAGSLRPKAASASGLGCHNTAFPAPQVREVLTRWSPRRLRPPSTPPPSLDACSIPGPGPVPTAAPALLPSEGHGQRQVARMGPPLGLRDYAPGMLPGRHDLPLHPREFLPGPVPFRPPGPLGDRAHFISDPRMPPPPAGLQDYLPPPAGPQAYPPPCAGPQDYAPPPARSQEYQLPRVGPQDNPQPRSGPQEYPPLHARPQNYPPPHAWPQDYRATRAGPQDYRPQRAGPQDYPSPPAGPQECQPPCAGPQDYLPPPTRPQH